MTITKGILAAVNNLCTGSEVKVLLAALVYDPATLSTAQMQKITGITKSNNYFRVRKQLLNLGYLTMDDSGMRVNTDKILEDYAKLPS